MIQIQQPTAKYPPMQMPISAILFWIYAKFLFDNINSSTKVTTFFQSYLKGIFCLMNIVQ
jgi:hypothetical protein